ncbi:potassium voltage-gated channel subfamily E member 3 isoform X1 [Ciconia boyciana]
MGTCRVRGAGGDVAGVRAGGVSSSEIAAPAAASAWARSSRPGRKDAATLGSRWHRGLCPSMQTYRLGEDMEEDNRTETWHQSLQTVLNALNQTLYGVILCPADRSAATAAATRNASTRAGRPSRNDNAYMYILFVMTLFAATVGSLILGYTRSRKVDKRSDPYHVYIKNRVSMI